ncbi:BnaCnng38700D [Brassica napus]|uniref:BnaCnng38700D protein n=1 Tax=Brassica napus TaxID=3708 RepID=A0A078J9W1_BRANA|nr:BnaCnng38700D [Brassica napus]
MLRNTKMEPFMVLRVSVNSGAGRNPDSSFLWSTTRVTSFVPVSDFYRGIRAVLTPYFLQQTVARFENYLGESRQWVEELEQ